MVYQRGDRVRLEGFDGRKSILRVWLIGSRNLAVCTEEEYARSSKQGGIRTTFLIPLTAIKGKV